MKKTSFISLICAFAVLSCGRAPEASQAVYGNPYLPLWEHVPDGEPHVFEDPDNPGQYRIYVYGSHDTRFESFCGQDVRCWSAPVDDLQNWRDEGPVFTLQAEGKWDGMWAPDVAEVRRRDDGSLKYYLYPHDRGAGRLGLVCVGDRPDGPFTPVNLSSDGVTLLPDSPIDFDPGVLVEKVDDPSDPDYNRGFRAYVAWGIMHSGGTELDPETMYSPRYGKPDFPYWLPSSLALMMQELPENMRNSFGMNMSGKIEFPAVAKGEDLKDFSFFEASSFRKVGNKYVFIYSGHSGPEYGLSLANSTLRYAYADSPRGPWKSGGILVEARGPVLSKDGSVIESSFAGSNTHGSLEKIGDMRYLFYHRAPRGFAYARQGMVAPAYVEVDEKPVSEGGKVTIRAYDPYKGAFTVKAADGHEYRGVEVTSEGFNIYGLPPYGYYSAGYACYMSNPDSMQDTWDIWDNRMDITGVKSGDILGYKYFGFGGLDKRTAGLSPFEGTAPGNGTVFNLFLSSNTPEAFSVEVWLDGPWEGGAWNGTKVGEISVPAGASSEVTRYSVKLGDAVDRLDGKHALFLVAMGGEGQDLCDIVGLGFTKKNRKMELPVPPQVIIKIDGIPVEMPSHPVWATDENGLTDCTFYSVNAGEGEITVEAPSSVKVEIDKTDRTVRCTYNGLTKTFCLE
ncbi:MAG: hypothetical protein IJL91_02940 [Bacteroidales bacterium]|nr:hypothetical protein [Bacteroidales bacterium]